MQEPVKIPPLKIWPDRDVSQPWQYLEAQTPVDFTRTLDGVGYAATIKIMHCGRVIWQAVPDLYADGTVSVTVPASVGKTIRSGARLDADGQIVITAPFPDQSITWVFPVIVHEVHT